MLDADVEVDRRDFTVRAALRGGRRGAARPVRPVRRRARPRSSRSSPGLVSPRRGLRGAGRPGADLDRRRRAVEVPPWQRRVGLLRQDPGLFPHLSVRAQPGLRAGPRPAGRSCAELGRGGSASTSCCRRCPARLSGGQAHRVALGRLLLARCDALLLDEPYTGLDASLRRALTDLVRDLVVGPPGAGRAGRPRARGRAGLRGPAARSWTTGTILQAGRARRGGAGARVPPGRRTGRLPGLRAAGGRSRGRGRPACTRTGWWPGATRPGPGAGRCRSGPAGPSGAGWEADDRGGRHASCTVPAARAPGRRAASSRSPCWTRRASAQTGSAVAPPARRYPRDAG